MSLSREAFVQVAPMLAVTDRSFRNFIRGITDKAELWTEMVVDNTLLHCQDVECHLDYDAKEHPIVCQLGGNDPDNLARASEVVQRWGYDEVNINVGCPSPKVAGKGCFGVALMKDPERVRDLVYSVKRRCPDLAVSIKARIGVDDLDSQQWLNQFVETVSTSGCSRFIIHARKAWLKGVSPSRNRTLPPLRYERVFQLVKDFPQLFITLNGGIKSLDEVETLLQGRWRPECKQTPRDAESTSTRSEPVLDQPTGDDGIRVGCRADQWGSSSSSGEDDAGHRLSLLHAEQNGVTSLEVFEVMEALELQVRTTGRSILEGVMIGRAALNDPCMLASVDSRFYNTVDPVTARTRRSILQNYMEYLDRRYASDAPSLSSCFLLMKPILGLLNGLPGTRKYRSKIDQVLRLQPRECGPSDLIRSVIGFVDEHLPGILDLPTAAQTEIV